MSLSARRAWIEIVKYLGDIDWTKSLSARRAWIEIKSRLKVAEMVLSLSARRAWIEILVVGGSVRAGAIALRKESVDRNYEQYTRRTESQRRSPQGERG